MDDRRWSIFTSGGLAVVALAVVTIIASLPPGLHVIGVLVGIVLLILASHAVFNGNVGRVKIVLAFTCLLFSLSLLECIWNRTLMEDFPLQLLAFILTLFSLETMTLIVEHRKLHMSTNTSMNALTVASWKIVQRRMTWLSIIFSVSYMLTIGAIYIGLYIHSIVPFLGDASVYLVAATVSLALLVTFRDDLTTNPHSQYHELS